MSKSVPTTPIQLIHIIKSKLNELETILGFGAALQQPRAIPKKNSRIQQRKVRAY